MDIKKLFWVNIISGKNQKEKVVSFLLNVESTVRETRERFFEECIEDTTRFEKSIKHNKIHTFARKTLRNNHKKFDEGFILFHFISSC